MAGAGTDTTLAGLRHHRLLRAAKEGGSRCGDVRYVNVNTVYFSLSIAQSTVPGLEHHGRGLSRSTGVRSSLRGARATSTSQSQQLYHYLRARRAGTSTGSRATGTRNDARLRRGNGTGTAAKNCSGPLPLAGWGCFWWPCSATLEAAAHGSPVPVLLRPPRSYQYRHIRPQRHDLLYLLLSGGANVHYLVRTVTCTVTCRSCCRWHFWAGAARATTEGWYHEYNARFAMLELQLIRSFSYCDRHRERESSACRWASDGTVHAYCTHTVHDDDR